MPRLGRPFAMPGGNYDHLAITLFYLHSRCTLNQIALTFGITTSTISRHIRNHLKLFTDRLPGCPLFEISWPSLNKIAEYVGLVQRQYELLDDCFGFLDGCRLSLQSPRCLAEQELFYNGWVSSVNIVNLFLWAPDGCLIYANYNNAGSQHDSRLAADVYEIMINDAYTDCC